MSIARMLPTLLLVAVVALVVAPVLYAFRGAGSKPAGELEVETASIDSETAVTEAGVPQAGTAAQKPRTTTKPSKLAGFDGDRAYEYLVEQCKMGPRISGSEANRKLRQRMAEHFAANDATVTRQKFEIRHPLTGEPVEMENIIASWSPDRTRRVVIGAHFDTRPRPDKETTAKKRAETFLGANDGASGVAVLMELATMMREIHPTVGVDLVAFDGEELVWDEGGNVSGEFFEGSKFFAQKYQQQVKSGSPTRYAAGIVVDMVGGNVLKIWPDDRGRREHPQLVQEIWSIARKLKATAFRSDGSYDVSDDHWPLLDVGIPAIDIIDFSYRHWHLASDTADKCSAASLAQVGGVVAEWLRGK